MIYLIIGRRERGKTSLAMFMARKKAKRAVLDPRHMIHAVTADRVHWAQETPDAVAGLLESPEFPDELIYSPAEDDLDAAFTYYAGALKRAAMEFPDREWAIVIDEASFFDLESPAFQWLAKCTPREKVHLFITAHRPQDIPTSIRSIADHWCVFAIRQEHDLKALRDRSEALARTVEKLQGREFAWWDDALGELRVNRSSESWRLSLHTGAMI